jgi:hypothetical protein
LILGLVGAFCQTGLVVLKTTSNGRSEVLGGFSDTTTAGKLAPKFVTDNSSVFTFFNEVCYGGNPFETLLRETRGTETKTVKLRRGHDCTVCFANARFTMTWSHFFDRTPYSGHAVRFRHSADRKQ